MINWDCKGIWFYLASRPVRPLTEQVNFMLPTYAIALLVTIAAVWWFRQTSEDIYTVLAAAVAAIGFIIGFATAPLLLKISILLLLLLLEKRYLDSERRNTCTR